MRMKIKSLSEVCDIINGGTPKSGVADYWEGDVLWLTPKDMGKLKSDYVSDTLRKITELGLAKSSAKLIPANSVILSTRAPIGHLAINEEPMATNQGCRGLVPSSVLDNKYLFYFLKMNVKYLNDLGSGTTFKELSKGALAGVKIPLPLLHEQKRIVVILDEAFAGIDQAIANTEKNLASARELFASSINTIFMDKGEAWEETELGEVADVEYGFTDKSVSDGDYRYVRITDIDNNGELTACNKKYISPPLEAEKFILNDNDLLMARTGATFAKVLLYKDVEPSIFASYLIRISFKVPIKNELYWFFSKSLNYWEQANSLSSGAAQPHFNGAALKKVIFSYPTSIHEQEKIIELFHSMFQKTQKLEDVYKQKLASLNELKQSLLQKAFCGELTTGITNEIVEAAE